jgi:tryptophanase
MKRSFFLSIASFLLMTVAVYGQTSEKLVSSKSNIKFFSTTPAEDIEANMITLDQVNFSEDGSYSADVEGELTIKGVTRPIKEKGILTVKGNVVKINSTFNVSLADYEITFASGKPSSNIAKKVEITVQAEYE